MKKSELQLFIKEEIKSILNIDRGLDEDAQTQQDIKDTEELTKAVQDLKKAKVEAGIEEAEEEGPSKADIKATKSLAKAKEELALLSREMKSLARKYKEAEGEDKKKIVADLKKKTERKKELDKFIDNI